VTCNYKKIVLGFLAVALLSSASALADGFAVPLDQVRTVAFSKPAATVYVGNPSIAEINMIDARHAFVLGKSFGTTNIVALDSAGHEVANTFVTVSGSNGQMVTLTKGSTQTTFSCVGNHCEVAPQPGDAHFGDVSGDISKHQAASDESAPVGSSRH
jgi:hypothetical protein